MKPHQDTSNTPASTKDYLLPGYWDERFQTEASYEWCKDYGSFRHLVRPHLKPTDKILVLGCGNSSLTADLWRDGFKRITSVDLSKVVIDKMAAKAATEGMHSLQWWVADMLSLPFEDQHFDAVLEKGTLDVLSVDNDSPWNPKPVVCARFHRALAEIHRVLSSRGLFISITFAQPHFRQPFLNAREYDWGIELSSFGDDFQYFVYIMKKGQKTGRELEHLLYNPSAYASLEAMTHSHMEQEDYLLRIDIP